MTDAFQQVLRSTAKAAVIYRNASRKSNGIDWYNSPERKTLESATVQQFGRITVLANVCGNTRRQHVRHTFKIDGKRASHADVLKLIGATS